MLVIAAVAVNEVEIAPDCAKLHSDAIVTFCLWGDRRQPVLIQPLWVFGDCQTKTAVIYDTVF